MKNKNLPNLITISRIAAALLLIPLRAFSAVFFVVYTYCGISDVLDGALARGLDSASENGARLDSAADIAFYAIMVFKIFPIVRSELTPLIWCIIGAAVLLRVICYITAAVKYRRFAALHTYMNKLTGFLVFSVPYIFLLPFFKWVCLPISIVAVIAAAEELIIHICSNDCSSDVKSIYDWLC